MWWNISMIILSIFVYLLGILSYMISPHPYEWTNTSQLATVVNSDAVLAILCLSLLGALCGGGAAVLFGRTISPPLTVRDLGYLIIPIIGSLICLYRFITILPYYSG